MTDLIHREDHQHNEKGANIMILPPTSEISHHHKVTDITMSPTSLSPILRNIKVVNPRNKFFLSQNPFSTPVAFGPMELDESMTVKIQFCDLPINVKIPVVVFIIFSL